MELSQNTIAELSAMLKSGNYDDFFQCVEEGGINNVPHALIEKLAHLLLHELGLSYASHIEKVTYFLALASCASSKTEVTK